jgi:hypothetical protein
VLIAQTAKKVEKVAFRIIINQKQGVYRTNKTDAFRQSNPRTRFNRFFIHRSVHLTPGLRSDPRVIGTGGRCVRYWFPNVLTRGAIQHFTAGLVFSAVAVELMPDRVASHHFVAIVTGFVLSVGFMQEFAKWTGPSDGQTPNNSGLVFAVGIDLLVDGMLVGAGLTLGA